VSLHPSHRTNRFRHAFLALSLVVTLSACTPRKIESPDTTPTPVVVADPMASFARLVSDEWKTTAKSGSSMFHTWHWGPGRHSVREMTDGFGADGNPWRELRVAYWHPAVKQVHLLGLSPYAAGVAEGTIRFDGETAEAVNDMYQTGGRRKLKSLWKFDGPDKYHDELLEATGPGGYSPLAGWDRVRVTPPAVKRAFAVEGAKPSERLKALEPLSRTWEVKGNWVGGDALHVRSTVEWVPLASGVYIRVVAPKTDGEPRHLLDAYVYHHTGTNKLRCLALSERGGVYEGDVTAPDGGGLQLDLTGHEGDQATRHAVQFDFEMDGTLHHRVWSVVGTDRTRLLDVHHKARK
jgi:hypothetical protein